jgi:uncharacterized protein (TIGR00730 family)
MKRLCIYCGSATGASPAFRAAAEALGTLLAKRGICLVYGGGNIGLMGAAAQAALSHGGEVIGVIPRALMEKELGLRECTELRVVASMHERKQVMADLSDGFIALPGGIGTLEELFETLTWQQLAFHDKPVGLLNVEGFYDHLFAFLRHVADQRFLRVEHLESLLVETDSVALLGRMAGWGAPRLGKWWERPAASER